MLNEFKNFILRGNVIDLSTGVIIGAAFSKIVGAFTDGIVNPLINLLAGNPDVSLKVWILDLGVVINAVISFLITAAVIFFVIIKPVNHMLSLMKDKEAAAPPAPPSREELLLSEIRDLLKAK